MPRRQQAVLVDVPLLAGGTTSYEPTRLALHDVDARAALYVFASTHGVDASTAAEFLIGAGFDASRPSRAEREAVDERARRIRAERQRVHAEQARRSERRSADVDPATKIRAAIVALFRSGVTPLTYLEVMHAIGGHAKLKGDLLRDLVNEGKVERTNERYPKYRAGPRLARTDVQVAPHSAEDHDDAPDDVESDTDAEEREP